MIPATSSPGAGHNRAPFVEIWEQQNLTLPEDLTKDNAALIRTCVELMARLAKVPAVLETQEQHDEAAQLVSDITKALKAVDAKREDDKAPTLTAGRVIDAHYAGITVPEKTAKKTLLDRITPYLNKKAAEERRRREEEAERLRAEAAEKQRAAAEAEAKIQSERDMRVAIESNKIAERAHAATAQADKAADAKPADLARTRTATGALSTLKREWVVECPDHGALNLNELRAWIAPGIVDAALRAAFRADPKRTIEGAKYYEREVASIR